MLVQRLFDALAFLLGRLPPALLGMLAHGLAFLAFSILRIRRKVVFRNLDIAFAGRLSEREKERMGLASLRSFALTMLEFIASRRLFPRTEVTFPMNTERFQAAIAAGKGIYILCIHLGNWELMAHAGGRKFSKPVHIVAKKVGGAGMSRWVQRRRRELGVFEVSREGSRTAWTTIQGAFSRGEIVGFIVDQRRGRGVEAPLFGVPSMTNASLFRLWRTLPAPVFPCIIHRKGVARYELQIWDEFAVENNPDWSDQEFQKRNAVRMNALVERMILSSPEEYFWMHDRWKGSPALTRGQ